jgi:hypothetical protein
MEDFTAMAVARDMGIPAAVVRVVLDPWDEVLPDLTPGLTPLGKVRPLAFLGCLLKNPAGFFSLPRLVRRDRRAGASLARVFKALLG